MRYFFHIGYNGFNYHGWQRQTNDLSIQEVLEDSVSKVLKSKVTILGCGRTDAQVHASQYFFHLDIKESWDFDLVFRINKILPADISVFDIIPVEENQHAQFDAKQRTYDYFIHTYKDPFLTQLSSFYLLKIDLKKIKNAVSLLEEYKDYRSFCKSPEQYKHTICNISSAKIFSDKSGEKLRLQISSDRFLQGMIRAIVAKLIKVGTGEISLDEFAKLLIEKKTEKNLEFAYPQGLYLSKVVYPFLDIPEKAEFSEIAQKENDWELV